MSDTNTRADSLGVYFTGAGSDGGSQATAALALGNYRSATEETPLGITVTSAIANVTVDFAAGLNGTGSGSLTAVTTGSLAWTAPGDSQGTAVAIANGESKVLESAGSSGKYIRVTRTSAASLTGTATVTLASVFNNVIGMPNVTSSEATSGKNYYLAYCLKNRNSISVGSVKVFLKTLGTQRVSDSAQLGASGSGTVATTGSLSDWPDTGFARIMSNVPAIREIVYYSSRTSTTLTVPSAGRGLLGTSAGAGAATDTMDAVPGIRIAKEAPSSSHAQTIADINTAPTGVTWNSGITAATGISIGDLATTALYFLWIHRVVIAGEISTPSVLEALKFNFDAA